MRLVCFFLLAVTGVALEFGQTHVPGRSFELWDMVANGMGVLYGYSIPSPDGNSPRNRLVELGACRPEPAAIVVLRKWCRDSFPALLFPWTGLWPPEKNPDTIY